MKNSKIMFQVKPNSDSYNWKELSCIQRPIAVAIDSFGKNYFQYYLVCMSFLTTYFIKNEPTATIEADAVFNKNLSNLFGIKMERQSFESKFEMIYEIKKAIDKDEPVIVPIDMKKLFYNPMYLKESHYKMFLVKGYDLKRNLFYILDNVHIDYGSSILLSDFISLFDELYDLTISYAENYQGEEAIPFFLVCKQMDIEKKLTDKDVLQFLKEMIQNIVIGKESIINWEMELENVLTTGKNYNIEELCRVLNFKTVFYKELYQLLERNQCEKKLLMELQDMSKQINDKWNSLRLAYLIKLTKKTKTTDNIEQLRMEAKRNYEYELDYFSKLLIVLDSLSNISSDDVETFMEFTLHNPNDANVVCEDEQIKIEFDDHITYDTWDMQDNAIQLLYSKKLSKRISRFSVNTKLEANIGDSYQVGIIVKLEDGEILMFGNCEGSNMGLFCPQQNENYELYYNVHLNHELEDLIHIEINDHKISFWSQSGEEKSSTCIYVYECNAEVKQVGIYARSWQKCCCKVCFSKIEYSEKE